VDKGGGDHSNGDSHLDTSMSEVESFVTIGHCLAEKPRINHTPGIYLASVHAFVDSYGVLVIPSKLAILSEYLSIVCS
jgi:hypothetical protein